MTSQAIVEIRVADENDNAPVFHNIVTGETRVQVFGNIIVSVQ